MGNPDARVAVVTGGAGRGSAWPQPGGLACDGGVHRRERHGAQRRAPGPTPASIAARAVVHLGAIVAPQARIRVGWVAGQ